MNSSSNSYKKESPYSSYGDQNDTYKQALCHLNVSKLKFVVRKCDFCGNEKSHPVYSVHFLAKEFCFVRCSRCGLIYQNPLLDQESRNHIYGTLEYWDHKYVCSTNSIMLNYYSYLDDVNLRRCNAEIRKQWMNRYLPDNARILDLGCSDGLFVHTLSESGYRASGIDVNSAMIAYGRRKYNVDIQQADFEKEWPFTEEFDAITCFATLSNEVNPSRVFNNIRQHLRIGGCFFFNFGDCDRLLSRIFGSRLYLYRPTVATIYSKKTIINYCQKYGLRIQEIFNDVQVISLARLLGFFRIPGLTRVIKYLGLEKTTLRMRFLTGYLVCTIHCNQR
ncbi:MAG: class I SAM-dependent methyltransferase [bacterium]